MSAASMDPKRAHHRTWFVVAAGVVAATALGAGSLPSGPENQAQVEAAYRKLDSGRIDEAARDFQSLLAARPAEAYEGLARVALHRNELAKAEELCAEALKLDAQRPGCRLVEGDIQMRRGNVDRAAPAYKAALAIPGIGGPQQAIAYNRVGRLAAEQGQADQAEAAYARAQEADPRNWESYSNLGALLHRRGRYAEAMGQLQKAALLRPEDPLVQALLRDSQDAASISRDRERQKRVDALIRELSQRYKRGNFLRPPAEKWTAKPLTLSLLGLENRGRVAFREGEGDFLLLRLGQLLEEQTRIRLVERNVLEKLLEELKLSSSNLVDPRTALRLGQVLSARLISVGTIAGTDGGWQLSVKVIETETSAVTASVARSFALNQSMSEAAELVAKQLAAQIRRAYPLRALVVGVGAGEVTLDVGARERVVPGQRLQLFREDTQGRREVIAAAEVVEVHAEQSLARLLGEPKAVVPGLKAVEAWNVPPEAHERQTLAGAPPTPASPIDSKAPKILINYPPPDARVEGEQITVLGLITHDIGVERVQITLNGVEVSPGDRGVGGKSVPIRVTTPLALGANLIEILAADGAGNAAQVVRTVTRVGPGVGRGPLVPPAAKVANRWAVVIGVGEFEHRGIPRLQYAARDAAAMYQFLTTKGGYPKDNVLLLTDTTPEKPTLQNIRRALGDFLFRKPGRNDMVLIYYAGHGAPEVDAAGTESDGLSKYLIPRDADPDSLYSTALPMDEIQRIFARIVSERVVMFLDACYSGTTGGRTFARQLIRSGNLNDQFLERLTRSRGRVVITASGPNEVALELPNLGHGIFTYYLLEGLTGKADRNGDGIVTVAELYEYVEEHVDRKAREAGGRQRPLMKGEIEGTLPLARAAR